MFPYLAIWATNILQTLFAFEPFLRTALKNMKVIFLTIALFFLTQAVFMQTVTDEFNKTDLDELCAILDNAMFRLKNDPKNFLVIEVAPEVNKPIGSALRYVVRIEGYLNMYLPKNDSKKLKQTFVAPKAKQTIRLLLYPNEMKLKPSVIDYITYDKKIEFDFIFLVDSEYCSTERFKAEEVVVSVGRFLEEIGKDKNLKGSIEIDRSGRSYQYKKSMKALRAVLNSNKNAAARVTVRDASVSEFGPAMRLWIEPRKKSVKR